MGGWGVPFWPLPSSFALAIGFAPSLPFCAQFPMSRSERGPVSAQPRPSELGHGCDWRKSVGSKGGRGGLWIWGHGSHAPIGVFGGLGSEIMGRGWGSRGMGSEIAGAAGSRSLGSGLSGHGGWGQRSLRLGLEVTGALGLGSETTGAGVKGHRLGVRGQGSWDQTSMGLGSETLPTPASESLGLTAEMKDQCGVGSANPTAAAPLRGGVTSILCDAAPCCSSSTWARPGHGGAAEALLPAARARQPPGGPHAALVSVAGPGPCSSILWACPRPGPALARTREPPRLSHASSPAPSARGARCPEGSRSSSKGGKPCLGSTCPLARWVPSSSSRGCTSLKCAQRRSSPSKAPFPRPRLRALHRRLRRPPSHSDSPCLSPTRPEEMNWAEIYPEFFAPLPQDDSHDDPKDAEERARPRARVEFADVGCGYGGLLGNPCQEGLLMGGGFPGSRGSLLPPGRWSVPTCTL